MAQNFGDSSTQGTDDGPVWMSRPPKDSMGAESRPGRGKEYSSVLIRYQQGETYTLTAEMLESPFPWIAWFMETKLSEAVEFLREKNHPEEENLPRRKPSGNGEPPEKGRWPHGRPAFMD